MAESNFTVDEYVFVQFYDKQKLENRAVDDFKFKRGDVVVSGFPKSGNTWLIEVVKSMYSDWGLWEYGGAKDVILIEERMIFKENFCRTRQEAGESINYEDLP